MFRGQEAFNAAKALDDDFASRGATDFGSVTIETCRQGCLRYDATEEPTIWEVQLFPLGK